MLLLDIKELSNFPATVSVGLLRILSAFSELLASWFISFRQQSCCSGPLSRPSTVFLLRLFSLQLCSLGTGVEWYLFAGLKIFCHLAVSFCFTARKGAKQRESSEFCIFYKLQVP